MRRTVYRLSLVLIFMMPWEGAIRFASSDTGASVAGLVIGALWLTTVVMSGHIRRPDPFLVAASLFMIWSILSILWSTVPSDSLGHAFTWAQTFVLAFMLWDLYRTREAVLAGLQAYVLGAYVAIGSAVGNYFSSNPYYTNYERFSAGDTNPDGFGFIIALGVPVAWYLATCAKGAGTARFLRFVNWLYIPAAFLGLALSGTRTAAIAAAVGAAFGLFWLRRVTFSTRVIAVVILTVGFYYLLPLVEPLRSFERFSTTGTELTEGDLNGRRGQWSQGLDAFAKRPISGLGTNTYRSANTLGKVAHNTFLSILVEVGLVGMILFGMVLGILILRALRRSTWDRTFWISVLLVWAIGASSLTWESRRTTWLFLTLMAISQAVQVGRSSVRRPAFREHSFVAMTAGELH